MEICNKRHGLGRWLSLALVGACLSPPESDVRAQNVSTAVGLPDLDPASPWYAACSVNGTPAAPGARETSQLRACTAASPGQCLHRVTIPRQTFPAAVCNDGSPGVFYV